MVLKTREKLIDVARQLFVHKGVENTTMNDIAAASDKGRRTIYTYFKNKLAIYNAVIERESERQVERIRLTAQSDLPPEEKLRQFLIGRFDTIDDVVAYHPGTIRSLFTLDFKRVERIRRLAIVKEREILREILHEGVRKGIFSRSQADRLEAMLAMVFQGAYYCMIKGNIEEGAAEIGSLRRDVIDFVMESIVTPQHHTDKSENNTNIKQ